MDYPQRTYFPVFDQDTAPPGEVAAPQLCRMSGVRNLKNPRNQFKEYETNSFEIRWFLWKVMENIFPCVWPGQSAPWVAGCPSAMQDVGGSAGEIQKSKNLEIPSQPLALPPTISFHKNQCKFWGVWFWRGQSTPWLAGCPLSYAGCRGVSWRNPEI